ncbi:MAG: dTDP-glucose 4,6-dehydratase [Treponema sp.]|jgi:dTDP-glucose 4,6-dehydratase|nr:dTDP-glucose 4,6-dehydratase [Treponema sp.]
MRSLKNILVTGGCGFIGANFIYLLFKKTPEFTGRIINLDALTYAGNITSLQSIEKEFGIDSGSTVRYFFELGDICDRQRLEEIFTKYNIDTVVNFAAESHVDRSILGPETFVKTNVMGAFSLLDVARRCWQIGSGDPAKPLPVSANAEYTPGVIFHHISTDEVYGSLGETGLFTEATPYDPRSPYSASKAASDHLVMAWHHTYGLPVTLSNCSNNFGPFQFPEKLIPLMIINMLEGKPLPVYGDGKNIRDWLYVEDHVRAIWTILVNGKFGEKYNIGGENERENVTIIGDLIQIVAKKTGADSRKIRETIRFIKDRPGHDRRYAIDCSKIKKELGWKLETSFEEGLNNTVDWYMANTTWIDRIRSGEYRYWVEENYGRR